MRSFYSGLLLAALATTTAAAHDIPLDVAVHTLVQPQGNRLRAIVRMPLSAVRDVEFPAFGPGYLDVNGLTPQLHDLAQLWVGEVFEVYENGVRLPPPQIVATQISLPSDRSLETFDEAAAHIAGPKPPNSANLMWDQVWFDVLLEYPIESEQSRFSIRPGFQMLAARVVTVLRFLTPGGAVRAYEFVGDPGVVPLDPSWFQAAWRFVVLGFFHILGGIDHLLFLACLIIPFRRMRPLIFIVTAFTLAHSLTLIASAYNFAPDALWFPPLVETLIAATIVYMALENIVGATPVRRRWMFALGFGLIHGFGFSFALRESLQFAGTHLLTSLLSFNVGVELGQLLVLVVLVPLLGFFFEHVVAERMGVIILSALIAHTGWHWMTERAATLNEFALDWTAVLAALAPWLIFIACVCLGAWAVDRLRARAPQQPSVAP